jgi:hypothetical protein
MDDDEILAIASPLHSVFNFPTIAGISPTWISLCTYYQVVSVISQVLMKIAS